jgi:hypothetical protein
VISHNDMFKMLYGITGVHAFRGGFCIKKAMSKLMGWENECLLDARSLLHSLTW